MNAADGTAAAGGAGAPRWFAVEGEWIDPLGFASLLSTVLWENYGRELRANWPGDPTLGGACLDDERARRTSRWLA